MKVPYKEVQEGLNDLYWERREKSKGWPSYAIPKERVWWRSLSRRLGGPVGAREARFWRGSQSWIDGRPAFDMKAAGLTPGQAAGVYHTAEVNNLWENGYYSPYSPNALFVHWMRIKQISGQTIRRVWLVCGERPSANPERRLRTISAMFRLALQADNDEPVDDTRLRWMTKHIERCADRFGYRGFLAGIGAAAATRRVGIRSEFWTALREYLAWPLWRLKAKFASPKKQWHMRGFEVGHEIRVCPNRALKTKAFAGLYTFFRENVADCGELVDYMQRIVLHFEHFSHRWVVACSSGASPERSGLHDGGVCLPKKLSPSLRGWITNNIAWMCSNPSSSQRICRAWFEQFAELAPREIICELSLRKYELLPSELGALAEDVDLPGSRQKKFLKWAEKVDRERPTYETIPPVDVAAGEWHLTSLKRGDPRGPWLGEATNCCQHPGGVGSSCAKHGALSPYGGFWVARKSGKIVAQSWVWRSGATVVVDNIEALSDFGKPLLDVYVQAAGSLVGRLGIEYVNVGEDSDISVAALPAARACALPSGYAGHTDAAVQRRIGGRKE